MRGKRLTQEEFIQKAIEKHGEGTYDYSRVEYKGVRKDVTIGCCIHRGYWFDQNARSHVYDGKGCPRCGHILSVESRTRTLNEFISEANKVHNNAYDYSLISGKFVPDHLKVEIICGNRGHKNFEMSVSHHLHRNQGCPTCYILKKSSVTNYLFHLLLDYEIDFDLEKRFETCRSEKYDRMLPFDFYFQKYNLLVELDGKSHYRKDKEGEETRERDETKNRWADDNGYILIRIPYWEYENLENLKETVFYVLDKLS